MLHWLLHLNGLLEHLGFIFSSSPTHEREILESVRYKVKKDYINAITWATHYFQLILLTLVEMLYVVPIYKSQLSFMLC
jgi:hypothetical protein